MKENWNSIEDAEIAGKTIFVRVDYNVPLENRRITDPTRIIKSFPTLDMLLQDNARLVLASHLGRPKDKKDSEFSLKPVAEYLSGHYKEEVPLVEDYIDNDGSAVKQALNEHRIVLLENLRFYAGEKKGDEEFGKFLASFADIYVNDAFGTAHRAHASISVIPKYIPGYPGLLMRDEIKNLTRILNIANKDRPFMCILGGAKISDKIPIINNLLERADVLMIGGGMAFTFLKALGMDTGKSLVNDDSIDECKYVMEKAKKLGIDFVLPMDVVVASGISSKEIQNVEVDKIPSDMMGLDIGEETREMFINIVQNATTIFWNGPMGVFEEPSFRKGTEMVAKAVANTDSFSVVGGGDSVALINELGIAGDFGHLSTGGGASLEFISGVTLPGIKALMR